ncbi:MAG TPA: hypothetical protein VGM75_12810 [Pseudonocardiaceae bacterium]|jgi:hypothetical protein
MSNAIGDVEAAGQAVKVGLTDIGDTIEKEFGGAPAHGAEPTTTTPDNCGPMGCDDPAQV